MSNRLMTREEVSAYIEKIHDEVTAPRYRPPPKPEPEDLTKLTDEALELRIMYSQDGRAGESFSPLWEEFKRRYHGMKALARTAVHGKGCKCADCRSELGRDFG